jgi:hypothetical protein
MAHNAVGDADVAQADMLWRASRQPSRTDTAKRAPEVLGDGHRAPLPRQHHNGLVASAGPGHRMRRQRWRLKAGTPAGLEGGPSGHLAALSSHRADGDRELVLGLLHAGTDGWRRSRVLMRTRGCGLATESHGLVGGEHWTCLLSRLKVGLPELGGGPSGPHPTLSHRAAGDRGLVLAGKAHARWGRGRGETLHAHDGVEDVADGARAVMPPREILHPPLIVMASRAPPVLGDGAGVRHLVLLVAILELSSHHRVLAKATHLPNRRPVPTSGLQRPGRGRRRRVLRKQRGLWKRTHGLKLRVPQGRRLQLKAVTGATPSVLLLLPHQVAVRLVDEERGVLAGDPCNETKKPELQNRKKAKQETRRAGSDFLGHTPGPGLPSPPPYCLVNSLTTLLRTADDSPSSYSSAFLLSLRLVGSWSAISPPLGLLPPSPTAWGFAIGRELEHLLFFASPETRSSRKRENEKEWEGGATTTRAGDDAL